MCKGVRGISYHPPQWDRWVVGDLDKQFCGWMKMIKGESGERDLKGEEIELERELKGESYSDAPYVPSE